MSNSLIIQDLKIQHFRGLNNLELNNLSRINIIVGANNCGKTSVLEAVKVLGEPNDFGKIIQLALSRTRNDVDLRGEKSIAYVSSIFQKRKNEDTNETNFIIQIAAKINNEKWNYRAVGHIDDIVDSAGVPKQIFNVNIKTSNEDDNKETNDYKLINNQYAQYPQKKKVMFPSLFIHCKINYYSACFHMLNKNIINDNKSNILNILQTFDSNITDISLAERDIYLHHKNNGAMPLFLYGSGMQKALMLAVAIMQCKNGIILIDEIDNAIHVSALESVFRWFLDACERWNVQAFITTHSAEALDTMIEIAHTKNREDNFLKVITLRKNPKTDETIKKVRTYEEALEDRECFKMELRV